MNHNTAFDITMHQGASLLHKFTLQGPGHSTFNLTDYTARLHVRSSYGKSAELQCDLDNGRLVLADAANGVLQLKLSPADTRGFKFDGDDDTLHCKYQLEVTSPTGFVTKVVSANFTLHREITK